MKKKIYFSIFSLFLCLPLITIIIVVNILEKIIHGGEKSMKTLGVVAVISAKHEFPDVFAHKIFSTAVLWYGRSSIAPCSLNVLGERTGIRINKIHTMIDG